MYDRVVTQRMVEAASRARGVDLLYHSQDEVDFAVNHFNTIWDPDAKQPTRALTPEELAYQQNERLLCALDFRTYWLPRYAKIIDKSRRPSAFVPNVAQNIVMDGWAESERKGVSIQMLQLKARRLGVSTISELNITHRFQFQPNSNCVLASADPGKTTEMAGMLKFALEQQPWWLRPTPTKVSRGIPVEHGDINSSLALEAGNQMTGVGRGSTPNVAHLSELCEWRNPKELIEASLLPAIFNTPDVFVILESTAKGPGWLKDFWDHNTREWPNGGRMRPVFLPWFVGTDLYPSEDDMLIRPVPSDWIPSDRTIAHAEKAREFVLSDELLFTHLAKHDKDWVLPRQQMWWREYRYEAARESRSLNVFLSEFCADPVEAFTSQNVPVIDTEILLSYQDRARQPKVVYTVAGPDIPPNMVTARRLWRTDLPIVNVSTKDILPNYPVTYQLIPIHAGSHSTFDPDLKLLVWEEPQDGEKYGVGVDCSEGVGQDNCVISAMREATPLRAPGQVAEWASNLVTAFQLWPVICAISAWYSVVGADWQRRQCRLAIETWSNGAAAQNEIQKRGWINFHPWMYAGDSRVRKRPGDTPKVGVMTNAWFRSMMQDMFLTNLSEESIDLPSPYLVDELTTLEYAPGTRKAVASPGCKDDRFMATGIIMFSLHMNKAPSQQLERKRVEFVGMNPEDIVAHPMWRPPSQDVAQPFKPGARGHAVAVNGRGKITGLMAYDKPIGR